MSIIFQALIFILSINLAQILIWPKKFENIMITKKYSEKYLSEFFCSYTVL